MNKKKVLQIAYGSLANGGIQAVIMNIVRNLYKEIDFDVLLFSNKDGFYDEEFFQYGKIFRIPCDKSGSFIKDLFENITRPIRSFIGTYKILKKGDYSAVHCHNGSESGISLLAARMAGVPIRISHSHNTASPKKTNILARTYKGICKSLIKRNSTIRIGCSKAANEYLFGKEDIEAFVVNNAIDLNKFDPSKYENLKDRPIISFIHIGRFGYQKNQLFLIDVFNEIHKAIPSSELKLVGFGKEENKIYKKIYELGLDKCVEILPHNSDIPMLLSNADYMIFPSRFEGLGIVLIEAQVMGVKCFVSDAVPKEADLGLLSFYSLDDGAKDWANKILNYINSHGNGSREISETRKKQYDIKEIIKTYKSFYE